MGLFEPWHIIILFVVVGPVVGAIWGYSAGSTRTIGSTGGLLLGLFLGFLGVLIVYCTGKIQPAQLYHLQNQSKADELKKYKQLLDSGAITETEYNVQKAKILNS